MIQIYLPSQQDVSEGGAASSSCLANARSCNVYARDEALVGGPANVAYGLISYTSVQQTKIT